MIVLFISPLDVRLPANVQSSPTRNARPNVRGRPARESFNEILLAAVRFIGNDHNVPRSESGQLFELRISPHSINLAAAAAEQDLKNQAVFLPCSHVATEALRA